MDLIATVSVVGMSSLGLLHLDNNPSSWLCTPMKEGDLFSVGQTLVGGNTKSECSSIRLSAIGLRGVYSNQQIMS